MVRCRPGRPERRGRAGRVRGGRVTDLWRLDLPRCHVKRGRMGAHHDRARRPDLPVRIGGMPGGVCGRRGDPGPLWPDSARRRRGIGAGRADRRRRHLRAGGDDTRRHRRVPGRWYRRPDQPVQPGTDHPGRLGRPAAGPQAAAGSPGRGAGARAAVPVRRRLDRTRSAGPRSSRAGRGHPAGRAFSQWLPASADPGVRPRRRQRRTATSRAAARPRVWAGGPG